MTKKSLFIITIALILIAIVAGNAFARINGGTLNGVYWAVDEVGGTSSNRATMYLYNNNNYRVHFRTNIGQSGGLDAYTEHTINCFRDTTLTSVTKW